MTTADLRKWRISHNLTQSQIAEMFGISLRTYQHLEWGVSSSGRRYSNLPLVYELAWCEIERRFALRAQNRRSNDDYEV